MCVWACVFGCMQPKHSFDSNLAEFDTILVWFTVPAHPTSDSPHPASRVAAVIPQKTECCIASVITQEGQLSLSSGLATLFVFHSERGAQRQPEVSLTSSVQSFFPSSFFPLCCLPLRFDSRLGDITIEKETGIQCLIFNPTNTSLLAFLSVWCFSQGHFTISSLNTERFEMKCSKS